MKRSDLVTALAEGISTDFFLMMLNPNYRGTSFRFSTFDIEGHVQSRLGINLPSAPTAKELEQASSTARKRWLQLIEQVGDGIPRSAQ